MGVLKDSPIIVSLIDLRNRFMLINVTHTNT